ncbi:MAG: MIP/aquaporin family protein, partial [Phycisphaerae bacterium]
MVRKCFAEVMGTFVIIFMGTGTTVVDGVWPGQIGHVGGALVWGLIVMTMIYAVGDVSGAHMNPAVTLGFWMSRRLPGRCVAPYAVSQAVGAFAASLMLRGMFGNVAMLGATVPAGGWGQSFGLEVVMTGA